jgi:hypothetical protein
MIQLTYWEIPKYGRDTEDDFDGILTVHLKSVKQIPELIAARPKHCAMISTERSAEVKLKNGKTTKYFKEVWRKGDPIPAFQNKRCPLCNQELKK